MFFDIKLSPLFSHTNQCMESSIRHNLFETIINSVLVNINLFTFEINNIKCTLKCFSFLMINCFKFLSEWVCDCCLNGSVWLLFKRQIIQMSNFWAISSYIVDTMKWWWWCSLYTRSTRYSSASPLKQPSMVRHDSYK